jgi:hypothetical protein
MRKTFCLDCGNPTAGGLRCKTCHGAFISGLALTATAAADARILLLVNPDRDGHKGITVRQLAGMLGVSTARAHQKIKLAREREEKREARA